jgi:tRNA threonylcarbamoyladenosine biosynthesis protein TsaB
MTVVLAFDTSTPRVSVAVVRDSEVIAENVAGELVGGQFHGELLVDLIRQTLNGLVPDFIAVGRGPGPYTGLRVGLATALVLGEAWGKPVVGIDTLHSLAAGHVRAGGGECIAVLDVKRREIAWQAFDSSAHPTSTAAIVAIADLDSLPKLPLVGPAFESQKLVQPEVADVRCVSAVDIALLAIAMLNRGEQPEATPLYLREPDAAEPKAPKRVFNV